jgi:hypothetical protein
VIDNVKTGQVKLLALFDDYFLSHQKFDDEPKGQKMKGVIYDNGKKSIRGC